MIDNTQTLGFSRAVFEEFADYSLESEPLDWLRNVSAGLAIRKHIEELNEEAREDGDEPMSDTAQELAVMLARKLSPALLHSESIAHALFLRSGGHAAYVLQDRLTGRRLTLDISSSGTSGRITQIDENDMITRDSLNWNAFDVDWELRWLAGDSSTASVREWVVAGWSDDLDVLRAFELHTTKTRAAGMQIAV